MFLHPEYGFSVFCPFTKLHCVTFQRTMILMFEHSALFGPKIMKNIDQWGYIRWDLIQRPVTVKWLT